MLLLNPKNCNWNQLPVDPYSGPVPTGEPGSQPRLLIDIPVKVEPEALTGRGHQGAPWEYPRSLSRILVSLCVEIELTVGMPTTCFV